MLDRGEKIELFDVRTAQERTIAIIDRARHLNDAEEKRLAALDRNATLVFHCHHGGRSQPNKFSRRLRGVENVRVADTSIMPTITSGNTNAPAMVLGMRAAALILASRTAAARAA